MIVQAFEKGSNFKKLIDIFYTVKSIKVDGGEFILVLENSPNEVLDTKEYEFKVCY